MKVVRHDHPRVDSPIQFFGRFPESLEEGLFGAIASENVRAIVAAIDHVITRTLKFDPWLSRHGRREAGKSNSLNHKLQSLTPFAAPFAALQKLSAKFVFLGILISSTIWCARIYKTTMHQAAIYRHRATSIQTLEAFAASAEDIKVKDAVVLEAARSVFGAVSTGYVQPGGDSGTSHSKLFDIVQSIAPGGKD